MHVGIAMFATDYSMAPTELAQALEERGFESYWLPEHSHIPLTRKSPFPQGGDLPPQILELVLHGRLARGDRAAASLAYRRCEDTLRRELDVDPSEDTRQLRALLGP